MTLKIALLLLVGIFNLLVGVAVFSRNIRKPMNIAFFGLALGVAAWVLGIAAFLAVNDASAAIGWAKFYYVAPLIIVASSVAFADTFPSGGRVHRRKLAAVLAGFVAIAIPLVFDTSWFFGGLVYHEWGKEIILNRTPYTLYSIYLAIAFALTLYPIYKKTFTEKGLYRLQAGIFFDGYLLSCVLGVFFNLLLPGFGNYQLIWVGPIASSFYVGATAYGIIKHRLFDIRIVVARSVGYVLATLAIGIAYGGVAFTLIGNLFGDTDGASNAERFAFAATAIVLAVTFRPLKLFFDRITNKLFYQDAYQTDAYIDKLNHILVSTLELHTLLASVSQLLQTTLKANYGTFLILKPGSKHQFTVFGAERHLTPHEIAALDSLVNPQRGPKVVIVDYLADEHARTQLVMQKSDIAVVARIGAQNHGEMLGYLLLGNKKSGNPYNNQDRRIIEATVNELLIAIQNAMRFDEIQRFNVTLEQRVEEATRKLRRSNEKLRQLDETKDDFISMASHQLRTPLTSVKGYVSMVLDGDAGPLDPMQKKLLNQAFISSQRMVYLISDLLNVSRLRTGKFVIEPVPTNLADVVGEEVKQLIETAKGRNLELEYHRPAKFPTLLFDETKLRQVIMNFIDNAIYYTPSGGHITVNLVERPQAVEFTVTDDGMGVPKAEQHRLFSKFYRADNAKRARPDGTGLGLFMAKKVIASQGGAIVFKSHEGKGSTFGFTFAKQQHLPPEAQAAHTE